MEIYLRFVSLSEHRQRGNIVRLKVAERYVYLLAVTPDNLPLLPCTLASQRPPSLRHIPTAINDPSPFMIRRASIQAKDEVPLLIGTPPPRLCVPVWPELESQLEIESTVLFTPAEGATKRGIW